MVSVVSDASAKHRKAVLHAIRRELIAWVKRKTPYFEVRAWKVTYRVERKLKWKTGRTKKYIKRKIREYKKAHRKMLKKYGKRSLKEPRWDKIRRTVEKRLRKRAAAAKRERPRKSRKRSKP